MEKDNIFFNNVISLEIFLAMNMPRHTGQAP